MKIMVVDQHVLFREGLCSLLRDQSDMEVIGEAGSVQEAVETAANLGPDVILMEIGLSDGAGLEAMRTILSRQPDIAVVVLTTQESDELLLQALRLGAKGYLQKNTSTDILLASLRALERGEMAMSRRLMTKVVDEFSRTRSVRSNEHNELDALTYREVEVLSHLGLGVTNREIAERLFISENTVRVHVHNILDKLRVRNRREAGKLARRLRLVDALESKIRLDEVFANTSGEALFQMEKSNIR